VSVDPLEQLLHRCHRDELLPLARLLYVDPKDQGLGDLARLIAKAFRDQGTNAIIAKVRGEGNAYGAILTELAKRRGLEAKSWPPGIEELEGLLIRSHLEEGWDAMPPERRQELWTAFGLGGDAPARGRDATEAAGTALGRSFGYHASHAMQAISATRGRVTGMVALSASPVGCLLRPLLLPMMLWWAAEPSEDRVIAGVLQVARLRQIVLHRVTIGVVGSPSTGKDAAIKTLFHIDTGNISPIAGSTREVAIQKLPGSTALYVVNTPGMGDVVERVTEEARQVLDHIDVYLYLVNAEGGVQAREKEDYRRCVSTGKPVLALVNKIDVLRPRDKDKFLADCRAKLGAAEDDFLPVAFDPLPELSPTPIGVVEVRDWLVRRLTERGKDPSELPPLTV
jgi:GTP-binding protein EngB required for normal cell division